MTFVSIYVGYINMYCLQCFDTVGRQEEHLACKNWVMKCRCGCLTGERCRLFAYVQLMPQHPKIPSSISSFKSRLVLAFWYWLTQDVLGKRLSNGCSSSRYMLCTGSELTLRCLFAGAIKTTISGGNLWRQLHSRPLHARDDDGGLLDNSYTV